MSLRNFGIDDLPAAKPEKELTPQEQAEQELRKKEANQNATYASRQLQSYWYRLPDDTNLNEREEPIGEITVMGPKSVDKLKDGIYRRSPGGDDIPDIRLKGNTIQILSQFKYEKYEGTDVYKPKEYTDKDFMNEWGTALDFLEQELGAKVILLEFPEDSLHWTADRIKMLIDRQLSKDSGAAIKFDEHNAQKFIDNLPQKDQDEIREKLRELAKASKISSVVRGVENEAKTYSLYNDNLEKNRPLNASREDRNIQPYDILVDNDADKLVKKDALPAGAPPGAVAKLNVDQTIDRVSKEADNIEKQLKDLRLASTDLQHSFKTYYELLDTHPENLVKSDKKGQKQQQGDTSVFDKIMTSATDSKVAKDKLLATIETRLNDLEKSKDACQGALNKIKQDEGFKPPKEDAKKAEKTAYKKRDKDIKALETRVDKADQEIESLRQMRAELTAKNTALLAEMQKKHKEVYAAAKKDETAPAPIKPAAV